jgi:hypothetical protein
VNNDPPKTAPVNVTVAIICMALCLGPFIWFSDALVHTFGFFALPVGALFAVWFAISAAKTITTALTKK